MQSASKSDELRGLRMTHGLIGSDEWWAHQRDGSLQWTLIGHNQSIGQGCFQAVC